MEIVWNSMEFVSELGGHPGPRVREVWHGRPRTCHTTKNWIYKIALRCAFNIFRRVRTSSPRAYAIEAAPYIKQLCTLRSTWENS
ncbi:hypothetical protein Y032_0024g1044 [Ancylostoma ceylanicum]|uniref:Uncharacterized protein n=1 Tax=Ancylostoma ceylanicum TaxID=53326 RepID=A0A016UVA3_9BILA|nr:hypothetical protein Y032_0024g1044 [Ancylostoma ceylanicum]